MKVLREKVQGPQAKTQREIAKELGVSPQYLNDVLGENRKLTTEVASALGFIELERKFVRKSK